ncbi:unnamed protein product, partial [Strongylus vulgaris]
VVTNVISTSHKDHFVNTFINVLNDFTNSDPSSTLAAQALEEAYKITVQPPSVIFLFTTHDFSKFAVTYLKHQHLGTQAYKITVQPPSVIFLFTTHDFSEFAVTYFKRQHLGTQDTKPLLPARQSGGRLLPLTLAAPRNILGVLTSIIKENALVYDDAFKNCTSAQTASFYVESTAARVILDITGNDVAVSGAVSVTDGQGNPIVVNPRTALLNDAAALVIDFPLKQGGPVGGKWTVTIKTTSGSCFIQVMCRFQ